MENGKVYPLILVWDGRDRVARPDTGQGKSARLLEDKQLLYVVSEEAYMSIVDAMKKKPAQTEAVYSNS